MLWVQSGIVLPKRLQFRRRESILYLQDKFRWKILNYNFKYRLVCEAFEVAVYILDRAGCRVGRNIIIWARKAKTCLRACAKCADSHHPAHAQGFELYILWYPMILLADREGPDQTARMRRLIWALAVRICPKTCFRNARPIRSLFLAVCSYL